MKISPRLVSALASLLILVVVAGIYGQVLRFDFVAWDDHMLVYKNPLYNPPEASKIAAVWRGPHLDLYTPLTFSLYGLLAKLSWQPQAHVASLGISTHLTPSAFHTANFILHMGCALLVYAVLRLALRCSGAHCEAAAVCGALLFALHPLQAEAVAWIAELKGMLSSFFVLCALWQFLLSLRNENISRHRLHAVLAFICFILALLSKPSAVSAPVMALALGLCATDLSWRTLAQKLAPWWVLSLVWVFVTRWAQPTLDLQFPLWWRPFVAGDALAFYLGKTIWPLSLASHYGRTPDVLMAQPWAYFMWLVPAVLALCLYRLRRRIPLAATLLFIAPLLPVLGLITFRFQSNSTVADRYAFLAMLGPALLLSWFLARRPAPRNFALASVLLLVLGVLSFRQTATWANSRMLLDHMLKVNPRSWVALGNLAAVVEAEGNVELSRQLYHQALEVTTSNTDTLNNIGLALAQQGDFDGAEKALRRSLAIDPNYGNGWVNLGNALSARGDLAEAVQAYQRAAQLLPYSVEVRLNLGLAHAGLGRNAQAITAYREALSLDPKNVETLFYLGIAYAKLRNYDAAKKAFVQAVQLKPDYWDARHAIGVVLLEQGQREAALQHWRALLKENPQYEESRRMLQREASRR